MAQVKGGFGAMPARQKATIGIFVLIAIIIIWQVVGLFRNSSGSVTAAPATPTPTSAMSETAPTTPNATRPNPAATAAKSPVVKSAPAAVVSTNPQQSKPTAEMEPTPTPVLIQQEAIQNHYISALNELQMLKIQREIAETSQAIVTSKLATATAEKSMVDLLAPMEDMGMQGPRGPRAAQMPPPPPQIVEATVHHVENYRVQSISMEMDQWHAVLMAHRTYYNVSIGDTLENDGAKVIGIDAKGVTLENGGVQQRLTWTYTDEVARDDSLDPDKKFTQGSDFNPPQGNPPPTPGNQR